MTKPFVRRGRRAPYSQLGDWVAVSGVPPQSVAAYWALEAMTFRAQDEDGRVTEEIDRLAEPSRETLAELLGFSRPQSVDPYLTALVEVGAIDKIEVPGYPNQYVVHQTPPDDYDGPQTMGQWHKRRAARKAAEKAAAEAAGKKPKRSSGTTAATPARPAELNIPQVETCAPERTPSNGGYPVERTAGVRSTAQQVCAPPHTKEEALLDPFENPPNPPRGGGNQGSPEKAPTSAVPRCEAHGIARCRACGLSVRSVAKALQEQTAAELVAAERAGRACSMCTADGARPDGKGTRWMRVTPGTQTPVTPYVVCDHATPHREVVAEIAAVEAVLTAPAVKASEPAASEDVRAAAMAEIRKSCKASNRQSRANWRESAAAVSSDKDGLETPAGDMVAAGAGVSE